MVMKNLINNYGEFLFFLFKEPFLKTVLNVTHIHTLIKLSAF